MTAVPALLVDAALDAGRDGWLDLRATLELARAPGGADGPEAARALALSLITLLLERGWMEAGDVKAGAGFVPWGVPTPDAVARIGAALPPPGGSSGTIGFLRITRAGEMQAPTVSRHARGPGRRRPDHSR